MLELKQDQLHFSFPDVHPEAQLRVRFLRTLRIPDDGRLHPLPAGLANFPLRHIDDHAATVPPHWVARGGVMMPMYQSEALWIAFSSMYPFAIKVAAGKINAVSGKPWAPGLERAPQDYVVVPGQPWLDGFSVEKGVIRQFVAMPLGAGYSAEEQLTGEAEHGGLQLLVHPAKPEHFRELFMSAPGLMARSRGAPRSLAREKPDMGLAPGGRMKQEIYKDRLPADAWRLDRSSRCFVHLCNSLSWREITGERPPHTPFTARDYARHGLPWFDYYAEGEEAIEGSSILSTLKSLVEMGQARRDATHHEDESYPPSKVIQLRNGLGKYEVRDGTF